MHPQDTTSSYWTIDYCWHLF